MQYAIHLILAIAVVGMMEASCLAVEGEKTLEKLELGKIEPVLTVTAPKTAIPDFTKQTEGRLTLGEKIEFDVYHDTMISRVLVGSCSMSLGNEVKYINGHWAVFFRLSAVSAPWYKMVYKIDDVVEGYFDIETSKTLFLELKKVEGSYKQNKKILFDYQKKIIVERSDVKDKVTYEQYRLEEGVVDAYSIFYLIRRQNLKMTDKIFYTIYSDGKTYPMNTIVVDRNPKTKIDKATVPTISVRLLTKVNGALEQKGGIFIYFTQSPTQLPIQIKGDVKIGEFVLLPKI